MDDIFNILANQIGLDASKLFATLAITMLICQFIARLIPNDATGVLGIVRKGASLIGLYVSARISRGLSVAEVAKQVSEKTDIVDTPISESKPGYKPPFPGPGAKLMLGLTLLLLMVPALSACATWERAKPGLQIVCNSQGTLAVLILDIRDENTRDRALLLLKGLETACPILFPQALAEANRIAAERAAL